MSRGGRKTPPPGERTPKREEPSAGGDDAAEREASFADLMGETERIAPGKQRPLTPPPPPTAAGSIRARTGGRAPAFRWPDPEDRSRAAAEGVSDTELFALGRGEPPPEERIDLHGARRDAAGPLVAKRLVNARARGLRCVLVVHGYGKRSEQGEAVLKTSLPKWLTRPPAAEAVLAFAPAPAKLGGAGATMVLLRRQK